LWKIADFGLTSEGTSTQQQTTIYGRGTSGYRPPEVILEGSDGKKRFNQKGDIWSLGCIAYELVTGMKAFQDDWSVVRFSEANASIVLPNLGFAQGEVYEAFSDLLNEMIRAEPGRRESIQVLQFKIAFHSNCLHQQDDIIIFPSYFLETFVTCRTIYSPKCSEMVTCHGDKLLLWNVYRKTIKTIETGLRPIYGCALTVNDVNGAKHIACHGGKNNIFLWGEDPTRLLARTNRVPVADRNEQISSVAFSHNGDWLAWGTVSENNSGQLAIRSISKASLSLTNEIRIAEFLGGSVFILIFHPDDTLLLSAQITNVKIRNVPDLTIVRSIDSQPSSRLSELYFHPKVHRFLMIEKIYRGPYERTMIKIYDLDGFSSGEQPVSVLEFESISIYHSTYSPDGNYILLSHFARGLISIHNSELEQIGRIPGTGGGPLWFCGGVKNNICLALSSNGSQISCINFTALKQHYGI